MNAAPGRVHCRVCDLTGGEEPNPDALAREHDTIRHRGAVTASVQRPGILARLWQAITGA